MSDPSIKEIIETYFLTASIEEIRARICARPDIFDVHIITNQDQENMSEHFKGLFLSIVQERPDEPA